MNCSLFNRMLSLSAGSAFCFAAKFGRQLFTLSGSDVIAFLFYFIFVLNKA